MKDLLFVWLPFFGNFLGLYIGYKYGKSKKLSASVPHLDWKWNDINKVEIPAHGYREDGIQLLTTDGIEVKPTHSCHVSFNRKGKAIMGYKETEITHWQYMPSPPVK